MLTLGHIVYSNCFPPHAGIVTGATPFPFRLAEGIPTQLNRMLYDGAIDVSPSSSIEYAMNPGRYLILPGLSITSRDRVLSILLESKVPIEELDKRTVAMTTASATSVILLRILLEVRYRVRPAYILYEQGAEDPADRADAVLTIGDLAIQRAAVSTAPHQYDLGALWHEFTGLPFVFALWHAQDRKGVRKELGPLYTCIEESKQYGLGRLAELAAAHHARFGIAADDLLAYWKLFSYDLDRDEQKGLTTYYGYAAEIGAIAPVTELRFWNKD